MSGLPVRHRVAVDEFERMVEAGVFAPDERLELVDGEFVEMSPIGNPHVVCVDRLTRSFARLSADGRAQLRVQGPFVANDASRPEPDLLLLRPREDFYADAGPGPGDLLLAVEVADASLRYDRGVKRPLCGRSGVAEMWIVDVRGRAVEVATHPSSEGYGRVITARPGDVIAPSAFPDVTVDVTSLFGL
jgi:Uma2 family endonuclease